MTVLSDHVKEFIKKQKLGFVATISNDNTPNLSPKGTIIPWGDDSLVFADIRSPNTIKNLSSNPNMEINIVDPIYRKGFRFKGTGKIIDKGTMFDEILSHFRKIGVKSQINSIVVVNVESISEVTSPLYDLGYSENEIKEKMKKHYNDF